MAKIKVTRNGKDFHYEYSYSPIWINPISKEKLKQIAKNEKRNMNTIVEQFINNYQKK